MTFVYNFNSSGEFDGSSKKVSSPYLKLPSTEIVVCVHIWNLEVRI